MLVHLANVLGEDELLVAEQRQFVGALVQSRLVVAVKLADTSVSGSSCRINGGSQKCQKD